VNAAAAASRRAVAALFLERQWLDRPRSRRLGAASLEAFVSATCGLQIDSVQVVDRAHHLTLWSRFGCYDRGRLERLCYRQRVIVEYLTHVACFVARRDLPLLRGFMLGTPRRWKRTTDWHEQHRDAIEWVAQQIAERGPLGTADFEKPGGSAKSGGWWDWRPTTRALDFLWKCGRIAVHSRAHFHKRYDLAERVLPELAGLAALSDAQASEQRLLRSLAAMGAASVDDLRSYWTWPQLMAPDLRAALRRLLDDGRVVTARVEGERGAWYVRAEDVPALERAARRRVASRGTVLLSPFDSLLWHRKRIERLWGYHYRIEIYVPGARRAHGYYSLPVLHDGVFIGRIDLKTHREAGVLEARHAHFEPWFVAGESAPRAAWGAVDRDAALAGLADALADLASHVGATRVELRRVSPASLARRLARAISAAPWGSPDAPRRASRRSDRS